MFDDQEDPYSSVDFNTPVPTVNADEITTVLKSFNGLGMQFNPKPNAGASTAGGVERVNANSASTGVKGYKDEKGQAVFTNVAKDPATGRESPILSSTGSNSNISGNSSGLPGVVKIDSPLVLSNILQQLGKATDAGEARGLFSSFQEAAAKEQIRLQSESLAAAQTKLGIPGLEAKLAQSEAADKSSIGWHPGIGDSPVTRQMRTELSTARGYADIESKRNLENNLSYKLLDNNLKQANSEMARIQKNLDRKANIEDNITLRDDLKKQARDDAQVEASEALTNSEMSRIQLLNSTDFVDEPNPRIRAFKVLKNNKNKDFQEAVTAEGSALPILALKGNAFARKITIAEESQNTGFSTAQVEADLDAIKGIIDKPPTPELKKQFDKLVSDASIDLDKKKNLAELKIRTAIQYAAQQKTVKFLGDTSSWNSVDPAFLAAQDAAIKLTGARKMDDVLTSYIGDSTGPEYVQKVSEFKKLAEMAADRHSKSSFGMPQWTIVNRIIADRSVESGAFRKWLSSQMAKPLTAQTGAMLGGPVGAAVGAWWETGNALEKQFPITGPTKKPIDPATGKPFGE